MSSSQKTTKLNPYQEHKYIKRESKSALRYMEKIIEDIDIGRLSFNGQDYPYIIPMNHYYYSGEFYWHCSFVGEKIERARKNKLACYIVDGPVKSQRKNLYEKRYYHDPPWISVISYGRLEEVKDNEVKINIISKYAMRVGEEAIDLSRAKTVNLIKLKVDFMTGRCGRFLPSEKRVLLLWNFKNK